MAGAIAGGLAGFILEHKYLNFKVRSSISMRTLRSIAGLVTVLAVYFFLNFGFYAIVGKSTIIPVLILYVIRYGLLGFWIAFGAPWFFQKIKLAD